MGSSKLIAKLGTKSASLESSSMTRKGNSTPVGVLSWEDIAGACARITNPLGSNVIRAKWALDKDSLNSLMLQLVQIMQDKAIVNNWTIHKPGIIENMVCMAIRELEIGKLENGVIVPGPEKCGRCKGRGKRIHGKTLVIRECPNCTGGTIKWYWRRARDIGLHRNVFARHWAKRYTKLLYLVKAALAEANIAVTEQLNEE